MSCDTVILRTVSMLSEHSVCPLCILTATVSKKKQNKKKEPAVISVQPPLTPFLRLCGLVCKPPEQKSRSAEQHPHALTPSQPQSAACGGWRVRGRRGRGGDRRERAAAAGHAAGGANPH